MLYKNKEKEEKTTAQKLIDIIHKHEMRSEQYEDSQVMNILYSALEMSSIIIFQTKDNE